MLLSIRCITSINSLSLFPVGSSSPQSSLSLQGRYPDCSIDKKSVSYPAFYFPDYHEVWDFTTDEHEAEEIHYEFQSGGNETKFNQLNVLLKDFLPVIDLYRKKSIPEEAFKMVLKGYLDKLPNR